MRYSTPPPEPAGKTMQPSNTAPGVDPRGRCWLHVRMEPVCGNGRRRVMKRLASAVAIVAALGACSSSHHSSASTTTTRPDQRATTSSSFVASACVSDVSSGISGTLRLIGGPPPGINRAVPGTVTVTSASGSRCDVPIVRGSFAVAVPVGTYTVTGHSPSFGDDTGKCSAGGHVVVTNARTVAVTVVCPVN